jgi:hypothetical protein
VWTWRALPTFRRQMLPPFSALTRVGCVSVLVYIYIYIGFWSKMDMRAGLGLVPRTGQTGAAKGEQI